MAAFVKGEVVVLPFPYTDLSTTKKRPALVLAAPRDDEVIVCQITAQASRGEYALELISDDFIDGGLNRDSYIRPNHLFTAEPSIISYSAGNLKTEKIVEIIEEVVRIQEEK